MPEAIPAHLRAKRTIDESLLRSRGCVIEKA